MVLSIGMIVKNEEKYLEKCLTALKPILKNVDSELIIADTGSADNTVEIAKRFTDNVYYFEWINDFAAARNSTLERAKGEWYMFLDADEIFQNCDDLIRFFNSGEYKRYASATFVVRSHSDTQIPNVFSDFRASRLAAKRDDLAFVNPVHEVLRPFCAPSKNLDLIADHYGYLFYDNGVLNEQARQKSERNLKMLLDELSRQEAEGNVRELLYAQIPDCYELLEESENALEYVDRGLAATDPESIEMIKYYANKFSLLWGLERFSNIIELGKKYFGKENTAHKTPLCIDGFIYAVCGFAYCKENDCLTAIPYFVRGFEIYKKFLSGELVTDELRATPFLGTPPFMKSSFDIYYQCCLREKRYDSVNLVNSLFPLSEWQNDHQYMLKHLIRRVEIMEQTNFNKLGELYYKLDNYNRLQLIRITRWHLFRTKDPKQVLNKFLEIVKGDKHLEDTLEIFRKHFISKDLTP